MINLSDLGRKKIRCMMFQTEEDEVKIARDNFDNFIDRFEYPVEIYNPNEEQKKMILDFFIKDLKINEGKVDSSISDIDFISTLLIELTNINMDLDKEKDKDKIAEIINKPSYLLRNVKNEIDKICNQEFYMWFEQFKELNNMPDEIKRIILE